jgi:aminomethyltransferase
MERLRTPLYDVHRQLGARLIDFGGWDMPVQYTAGTIKEHKAVREAVGLFDVSHMGEAWLRGDNARAVVDRLCTNNCAGAPNGKAVYTLLCHPSGGIVDDCIFYKKTDGEFMVILNASNRHKDVAWLNTHANSECNVEDVSDQTALIAVQGPKAVAMVDAMSEQRVATMPSFTFTETNVAGVKCFVGRTGYTGEDGFELACDARDAVKLWDALLTAATPLGGLPIGLGARDTLRLESKLPLYGNDLDDDHTPLEAGLGWAVKLDGRDFLGAPVLRAQKANGVPQQLVGFTIAADVRAVARHGYPVVDRSRSEHQVVGTVTSGGPGISVPGAIGLAYVTPPYAAAGTQLTIDCRGKDVPATVVSGKFYKRAT